MNTYLRNKYSLVVFFKLSRSECIIIDLKRFLSRIDKSGKYAIKTRYVLFDKDTLRHAYHISFHTPLLYTYRPFLSTQWFTGRKC